MVVIQHPKLIQGYLKLTVFHYKWMILLEESLGNVSDTYVPYLEDFRQIHA
jgi:hypothetical protein